MPQQPQVIEDYLEPGTTLEHELDDEILGSELDRQRDDILPAIETQRWLDAMCEAEMEAADGQEPTEEDVACIVRGMELQEKDLPPNWPH